MTTNTMTTMNAMTEVTELEIETTDGGGLWAWFVGNAVFAALDTMIGSPGCSGFSACFDAGTRAAN